MHYPLDRDLFIQWIALSTFWTTGARSTFISKKGISLTTGNHTCWDFYGYWHTDIEVFSKTIITILLTGRAIYGPHHLLYNHLNTLHSCLIHHLLSKSKTRHIMFSWNACIKAKLSTTILKSCVFRGLGVITKIILTIAIVLILWWLRWYFYYTVTIVNLPLL